MHRVLCLILLVFGISTLPIQALSADEYPNIVIIMADDMGYGDPGCFNSESKIPTPQIDRLAEHGMRFTDAHAPGPLCHLSRYGLMTGRYPFRANVGVWRRKAVIRDDEVTIASLLKQSGYHTAMVGKWHLGFDENGYENRLPGGPVDRGFDSFFGIRASTDIPPYFYIRNDRAVDPPTQQIEARASEGWSPIQGEFWRAGGIAPDMKLKDVLPRFTDEAIQVINNHAANQSDQPLMLYLAYPAPHTPWLPAPEFVGNSKASMYGDFVTMVDAMIGRVLKALEDAQMSDNTLVIFTSDNGPVWYEKDVQRFGHDSSGGLRGMKADAWEAGHRMPFVVRWPTIVKPGSTSDQTICFTDLLATFAEIVDVKLPDDAGPDSFGFLSVLNGTKSDDSPIRPNLVMASGNKTMSIRSGHWKLIEGLGSGGFSKPSRIKPAAGQPLGQLYDLQTDPGETKNLYSQHPQLVSRLALELKQVEVSGRSRNSEWAFDQQTNTKPNIVLLMADDQGWGQTGYCNHPLLKTPNLDAMAENGLRFDRFYAAAPVCSPTRASILTGRTNLRTGVAEQGYALRLQEKSIATALRDLGYATGHFGKWHLNGLRGPGVPILGGDSHNPGAFGFETWLSVTNFFDVNPIMSRNGKFEEFVGDSSEIIVDEAVNFIKQQADANKPFFTVIWYGTPHGPFMASDADAEPFSQLDNNSRNQLGELVAMDRSIGALRSALRDLGIADKTLVWFTSDNGGLPRLKPDTVGGLRGNKGSLYEGGLRVPTIVEWPAKITPRVTKYPAVSMDIFATIADVGGVPQSEITHPQDGGSLCKLFEKEIGTRDKPIPFGCFGNMALIDNDFKLLYTGDKKQKKQYELYDLESDPTEQSNLYQSHPKIAGRMKTQMDQFAESLQRSINGADYSNGLVNPGHPQPRQWTEVPEYKPYFDDWKSRPEYKSRLKSR